MTSQSTEPQSSAAYAEEPEKMFLPRPGTIGAFRPPEHTGVRIDGVTSGSEVTYYDPMIAKLTTHAMDRQSALDLAVEALDGFVIEPSHKPRILKQSVAHKAVKAAEFDTSWLERYAKGKID